MNGRVDLARSLYQENVGNPAGGPRSACWPRRRSWPACADVARGQTGPPSAMAWRSCRRSTRNSRNARGRGLEPSQRHRGHLAAQAVPLDGQARQPAPRHFVPHGPGRQHRDAHPALHHRLDEVGVVRLQRGGGLDAHLAKNASVDRRMEDPRSSRIRARASGRRASRADAPRGGADPTTTTSSSSNSFCTCAEGSTPAAPRSPSAAPFTMSDTVWSVLGVPRRREVHAGVGAHEGLGVAARTGARTPGWPRPP